MERRDFTKAVGGIVTTTAFGGATLLASSGGATATAGSTIDNPSAVTSDDGEITYVAVQATGRLQWDGFDEPATKARILTYVTLKQDGSAVWGENLIHDTGVFDLSSSWGGSGEDVSLAGDHESGQSGYIASDIDWGIAQRNRENNYNSGYGLPNNPAPVSPFTADDDGAQEQTKVVLRSVYILYDANESELTGQSGYPARPEASSSFVVTVNNQESSTSFGGDDGEGDTEDSAEVGV